MNDTPNIVVRLGYYPAKSNNIKYADKRAFYSSNMPDDYMRYVEKGVMDKNNPSGDDRPGADYMDYVGDNDKSSGVFSKEPFQFEQRA